MFLTRNTNRYILKKIQMETVEVEITSVVHSQRAWEAESRAERRQANGPRRARGKA